MAAAATTAVNPHYAALLATLSELKDDECWCTPAWMTIVLAFMAGPMELDTGQFFTFLFIYTLPHIIVELTRQAVPKDRAFYKTLLLRQAWLPQ